METLRAIVILVGLICVIWKADGQVIRVDGDDFVSYNMTSITWFRMKRHTISLDFKTVHPNGMLIYIGSEEELSDFVMLDLVHGKLRVTVNLGDNLRSQIGDLVVDDNLTDNVWHRVKLTLKGRHLNVTTYGQKHHIVLESVYTRLNINGFMYVGGLTEGIFNILRKYRPSPNFKGCIEDVYYRRENILKRDNKNKEKMKSYREYGSPGHTCQHVRFDILSFGYPKAFLKLPSTGRIYINVKMGFRTYLADGILVSKGMAVGVFPFVSVSLIEGKVFLKVRMSVHGQVIWLSRGKHLNDGAWHTMSVVVNETVMKLRVDELDELVHFNPDLKQPENKDTYFFIGYAPHSPYFLGCIHDLRVDNKVVDLTKIPWDYKFGELHNRCNLESHCFPNPCSHCGKCNDVRSSGFSCDCENTFYRGRLCEKPIYRKTCQDYKNLGLAVDAYCKVDPDAEGPLHPFKVLCNMTEQNQTVTVIHHNRIGPQMVSSATFIPAIGYFHRVKYSHKMEEVRALIAQSERCRQFASFKCFGSKLLQAPTGQAQVLWKGPGPVLVWDHWPGAPAGSRKCACGVNGTCADPKLSCNCDIGDKTWREVGGYVTDKSNLPITLFRFLPSAAQSNFTVGPLECFGTLADDSSHSAEETLEMQRKATRFFNSLCNAVNPTTPEPYPSVHTPTRTPSFVYGTVPKDKMSTTAATVTAQSTTEKATTEISTSQPTPTEISTSQPTPSDASVPPDTSNEVTKTAIDVSSLAGSKAPRTTTSSPVLHLATEKMTSDLPLNNTLGLGGSNGNSQVADEDESKELPTTLKFSWHLVVTVILLAVVSIMFLTAVAYFFKKQGARRAIGCALFRPKKPQPLAEVYAGFPEVRLRSRSGELDLPDVRRSIEAGSYNAKTGIIAYGDMF